MKNQEDPDKEELLHKIVENPVPEDVEKYIELVFEDLHNSESTPEDDKWVEENIEKYAHLDPNSKEFSDEVIKAACEDVLAEIESKKAMDSLISLQINSFLNSCESIITICLSWLANPLQQEQGWDESSPLCTAKIVSEEFYTLTSYLVESPEYISYADQPVFLQLKLLMNEVEEYLSSESIFNFESKKKLLNDAKWKEIQRLAKEVSDGLEKFIKKE